MKKKTKAIMVLIGLIFITAYIISFYYIFLMAYFNPLKQATVLINHFNEANIEFILMLLSFPFMAYTITNQFLIQRRAYHES